MLPYEVPLCDTPPLDGFIRVPHVAVLEYSYKHEQYIHGQLTTHTYSDRLASFHSKCHQADTYDYSLQQVYIHDCMNK